MNSNFLANWAKKYQEQHDALVAKYGADFEKAAPGQAFGLNVAEVGAINEWYESLRPEILAIQKRGSLDPAISDILQDDEPYYGATGGGLSYTFTPTSLGTILVVKEAITGKELNVSDALGWHFYG